MSIVDNDGGREGTDRVIPVEDLTPVVVNFEQASYAVPEGESVTVKVTLDQDPERTVTIPLTTTDQDGASPSDYSQLPANVVFDSGDTEKTFSVTATQDTVDDDGESVRLEFGDLPDGVTEGTTDETTISITDDDVPSVNVSFGSASYTVTEGNTVTVKVVLSADPERNVSVPLTIANGTGATSTDYSRVPTSVDFASGETEKSFIFTAEQDDIDEDSEELTLGFDTLPDRVSTGTTAQALVTIIDSIHVSFDASYYQAYEGGSGALVTVQLDNASAVETVIPITATGTNGATSADWTGVPDTLIFAPGESSKSFTVMAYDDTVEDSGESVQLGFGDLPPGVARGSTSTATVELMNMEVPQVNRHMCPSDAGERIVLESVGEITQAGESDFWRVKLDLQRLYIIEVLGKDSGRDVMDRDTHPGDLTLEDPIIAAIWDDGRNVMRRTGAGGSDDGGTGRNSLTITSGTTPSGWHEIEVQGKGGTGTYQIKVRVNNVCRNMNGVEVYPYFGGPDGYVLDTAGDVTTDKDLMVTYSMNWRSLTGYLGDNWSWYRDSEPDVDWVRVHLKTNRHYTIELWTHDHYAAEYQATDLKILGIYDADGVQIPNTSSADSGRKVTLTYEPDADGVYYVAVGSGELDRTGGYSISVEGVNGTSSRARAVNSPASGGPGIEGTPRTGQTLSASTTGIQDKDGMSRAVFSYQWIRHDLETAKEAEIKGATGRTYTVTANDEGKSLKVTVSFTDDRGNKESLTSMAVTISPAPRLRAERANSPATGSPGIKGPPVAGQTLTATTTGIADKDGISSAVFDYQWLADGAAIEGATASTYSVVPGDEGKVLSVRVSFTDDAGNQESLTSEATAEVQARPNRPATGLPTISGTAQVGQALAADTSGITDADGLDSASYTYQWIAGGTEIDGAASSTYEPSDSEVGQAIQVRVTFKDDRGNDESLTSEATAEVQARPNSPATGLPTISGTARVGQTLTADTSGIADDDGLDSASYTYQWIAGGTEIDGATSSTYEPTDSDVGQAIQVRVTFTDDGGHHESLTSEATAEVEARPNRTATGLPTISGTAQVGQTLTADTSGIADADGLDSASYTYQWIAGGTEIDGATSSTYEPTDSDVGQAIQVRVTFTDDGGHHESLTSEATAEVEARPNRTATGLPTISGTVQVGQTLTADTSGIADADGLDSVSYAYQWIAGGTDIDGAADSTYEPSDLEVGQTIQVRVTFKDDRGNDESLTSQATAAVEAVPEPLTASLQNEPTSHDGKKAFTFELRFSEHIEGLSHVTLRDHAFKVTGGQVKKAQRMDRESETRNINWRIRVKPDGDGDVTIVLPATTDCGAQGAICTGDDRKLSRRLELTVSGPDG